MIANMRRVWVPLIAMMIAVTAAGCGDRQSSQTSAKLAPQPEQPKVTMGESSDAPQVTSTKATPVPDPSQELPAKPTSSDVRPSGESTAQTIPTMPPATPPISAPLESKIATFAGFKAPKPATWLWQPTAQNDRVRVAHYVVPGRDGADQARITVLRAGGTLDANIARWISQFREVDGVPVEPKLDSIEAAGMKITLVEIEGDYAGMSGSYALDQLFITAIVPTEPEQLFIRFVGPRPTVELNRAEFRAMIEGMERVEPEK